MHAEGAFSIESWDEKTYQPLEDNAKLTHARIRQSFAGDLVGTGTWEVLMCYRPDGTAAYVGLVRVEGSLHGHPGTVVLETRGGFDGNLARWTWSFISGTGTGELTGISGTGEVVAPHGSTGSYSLEHSLESGSVATPTSVEAEAGDGAACSVRVPEAESEL